MNGIAVLGGGVSGVIIAKHLANKGTSEVDLIEKSERLGGLHRSVRLEGLAFDIGAFLFSQEHELLRSFPILYDRFVPVRPRALSVTPRGNVCSYPITVSGYLRDNGLVGLLLAGLDLLICRIRFRKRDTVPSFAKYYVGEQIYRRSGLQNYIERLFGTKDEQIGLEFALQRLAPIRDYAPTAQARRKLRGLLQHFFPVEEIPALVRPPEGFEKVYGEIAACLTKHGVTVCLGCDVKAIRCTADGEYEIDFGNHKKRYHRIVSTIPIPIMLRLLGSSPQVRFQHVSLLSLFYKGKIRYDASFIYNFTMSGCWKRITLFSSFYGLAENEDYFTVEITTQDVSPAHIEMLRLDFERHATELRICLPVASLRYLGNVVTERAYPLFQPGKSKAIQAERDKLTAARIDFLGRQGDFAYLSSHDAAQQAAIMAADID